MVILRILFSCIKSSDMLRFDNMYKKEDFNANKLKILRIQKDEILKKVEERIKYDVIEEKNGYIIVKMWLDM